MCKRKRILTISIGIFVFLIVFLMAGVVFFQPHPIIQDPDSVLGITIMYNPHFNQDVDALEEIVDYDFERIVTCLTQYKESRTFNNPNSHWIGDVKMQIVLFTSNGVKEIVLGNENYTTCGYTEPEYTIINSAELLDEISSLITLPNEGF